jgi:Xaa-Pro aminopeptidase
LDRRLARIRGLIREEGLDGVFISSPVNTRYFSRFTGTTGYLLITAGENLFVTDFRYTRQAKDQCPGFKVMELPGDMWDRLNSILGEYGIKKLGFEDSFVTYRQYHKMKEKFDNVELVPMGEKADRIRMVKDAEEIGFIRTAAEISEQALRHVKPMIRPGTAEKDISTELEVFMKRAGCSGPAFSFIVASGWRSAMPHGVASEKKIRDGDFVTIDFGGKYRGYCSDMTRTFVVGRLSPKQKEIYDIVLTAQTEALKGISPGMIGSQADSIARDIITKAGYGEYFGHGLGHGVGLQIHEAPTISAKGDIALEPGMAVTVEPGIYIPEFGGVRIEDLVIITDNGIENLNQAGKELTVL